MEIQGVVNNYCQIYHEKEEQRKKIGQLTKDCKEAHEKLLEEMKLNDLKVIRSMTNKCDIKLHKGTKKPGSSIKKLKQALQNQDIDAEKIEKILQDIQTGTTTEYESIKLISLKKTKSTDDE